jgi:hypothetical protein
MIFADPAEAATDFAVGILSREVNDVWITLPVKVDCPITQKQTSLFAAPDHGDDLAGKKGRRRFTIAQLARRLKGIPSDLKRLFD